MKKISLFSTTVTFTLLLFTCFSIAIQASPSNTDFSLVSEATDLTGGCYQLTPKQNDKKGAIWNNTKIDLSNSFIATFQVDVGFGGAKADGMTFALHRDSRGMNTIGGGSQFLGFAGLNNSNNQIIPGFAVAFEGYIAKEIEIWSNGKRGHNPNPRYNITTPGGVHDVTVKWDACLHRFTVDWDNDGVDITLNQNIVNKVFDGNPSNIIWGFTAGTGGASYKHRVCNINMEIIPIPEIEASAEILTHESGCGAGSANRVVEVVFDDGGEELTYTTNADGGTFINLKGEGMYQVVGNGTWSIEATTPNSCEEIIAKVESTDFVSTSNEASSPESGYNKNDGTATVGAIGGKAPYTVDWDNGTSGTIANSGGTHTLTGLASGYYEATVTDDDGETAKACIHVGRTTTGRSGRGRKTANIGGITSLTVQPNPLSDYTHIQFNLPENSQATLEVFGLNGERISTLFDGAITKEQNYQLKLDSSNLPSGMYLLRLATERGFVEYQRIAIAR